MKILILVGSADAKSHSLGLGQAIKSQLEELSIETELINLIEYKLPLYDRSIERAIAYDENTRSFLDKSLEADAFVWVSPIYHSSYSSMLKNALDWHHSTKFPGRVVGLASNGGNRSQQAADQLALVARSQHMLTIPTRVCTGESDYDANLQLIDPDIQAKVKSFCAELVDITKRIGA